MCLTSPGVQLIFAYIWARPAAILQKVKVEGECFYYAPRRISGEHIVAASSVRPCVRASVPLLSTQILGNCLSDFNETSWEY